MTKKQLLIRITFILIIIIIIVLSVLMIKFKNLYVDLKREPVFGYYLDRDYK